MNRESKCKSVECSSKSGLVLQELALHSLAVFAALAFQFFFFGGMELVGPSSGACGPDFRT